MEKRYDFTKTEPEMQALWAHDQTYRFDPASQSPVYSIDTPPPTVSGKLHMGHLFSYTQGDIIARFRRMQGYNVFYPFGFDDNGLPTERLVEREWGIRPGELPLGQFSALCRQTAQAYESEFQAFYTSLGFSVDWSLAFQTISPDVCRLSQALFLELVQSGKAYVKESPVLWCTECQTSIAQAELDMADRESAFATLPFRVGDEIVPVATTRPELLFGCVALLVHPSDERYRHWAGKTAVVPLYEHEVPVLADETVDREKGTGAVLCATFGDSADVQWVERHNLPYRQVLGPDGKMGGNVPYLAGLSVPAARREILRLLSEKGHCLRLEALRHFVGVHERCGTETEILPSRQWYIDILSGREAFLQAADQIRWHPPQMKNRFTAWVENLKWDWCISRQRYFGVPFPLWYCKACGAPAFARPDQLPVDPAETAYGGSCACGGRDFTPETAVMDTWATSSLTPQINRQQGCPPGPMSMRTHAHEIIRTWTFYTIVRCLYHTGEIPWKDLMICGFVLSKKGEKISKSKENNAPDPKALIQSHSADALRYLTAGAKLGTDTYFSTDELSVSKRLITKLWNAARFCLSHLEDMDFAAPAVLLPQDAWIVERTRQTTARAASLLEAYEAGPARHEIDELFWKDFCDYYIELVKDRLYEPEKHGLPERKSGQFALYTSLLNILKLYAPYIPHVTEAVYQAFFRRVEQTPSIHQTLWEKPGPVSGMHLAFGEAVKKAVADVRKYKTEQNLSLRAEIEKMAVTAGPGMADWFALAQKDLQACANARALTIHIV